MPRSANLLVWTHRKGRSLLSMHHSWSIIPGNVDRGGAYENVWPYDAAPYPANLSNRAFQDSGRIRQLVSYLEDQGFIQRPTVPKQQEQQSFLEVFPSPALVMLFPGSNRKAHLHYRALRYKHKQGRPWAKVHGEWEIYRARLRSLERREPPLKFSDDVRK